MSACLLILLWVRFDGFWIQWIGTGYPKVFPIVWKARPRKTLNIGIAEFVVLARCQAKPLIDIIFHLPLLVEIAD
ncbi:hypothetical protein OSB04_015137 [Centaurea solstitialis]|uniref:Uncharacterized protein n=1 Tax=Centaurea solstitialis TaxID=347529 RepID=A0AA38W755_9ASTR|nr:hypothetical protein OSB04_015137 [Centaurea solstitialis]